MASTPSPASAPSRRSTPALAGIVAGAWLAGCRSIGWASPITTTAYLGVTRITDSLTLRAPADQTPASGLGPHTANVNVIMIDLLAPGIGFRVSGDNGPAAGGSNGMAMAEEVDYLLATYAFFNLINLDGGGSTTLTMGTPPRTSIGSSTL